ncbi:MAG: indole-3-glycerol phosphate synthase TrpC [Acidobacteriaceae bacterium]|nr:indole-3-glycerol phosphate synthase TrpC [Acidobacteriaceae bacterium]
MSAAAELEKKMYLPEIVAWHRKDVERRKAETDWAAMEQAAAEHTPRGFAQALRERAKVGPAVIAELKKASPSKGLIRAEFDPSALAVELEEAGAAVLSVLTDEPYFQGSLVNLRAARAAVKIPLLRKDFMVDPFQVLEARANGADAILLIVAALDDNELRTLRAEARRLGLDVLCEVHDQEELDRARVLDCECVGVNTRDLKTFHVSLDRAIELASQLPVDVIKVAESGIGGRDDVQRMRAAGFDAFLIGESLMRAECPGDALRELLA